MYLTEGFFSFYKGNYSNCLRNAPFLGLSFYIYDKLKIIMNSYKT